MKLLYAGNGFFNQNGDWVTAVDGEVTIPLSQMPYIHTYLAAGCQYKPGDAVPVVDNSSVTVESLGLDNVDNTADIDKPISTAAQAALDLKADKVI